MAAHLFTYSSNDPDKQRGAALLIILLLLIVGIAAVLFNSLSTSSIKISRQANTAAVLAQAKDALIGYAVTYGDTHSNSVHGYLPCPDTDGNNGLQMEGSEETSGGSPCSSAVGNIDVSVIGRLPWKTLGLPVLRDSDGECLWYAVSGTYKDNPKTGLMNWDTDGQLQAYSADGTLLASQVVAVIFAPGAAQSGQDRTDPSTPPVAPVCGGNFTASNYLDNDTVHNITNSDIVTGKFIQAHEVRDANGSITHKVNDQFVYITQADIWNAVQKRTDFSPSSPNNPLKLLTKQVAVCIASYGHFNYGFGTGSGWSSGSSNLSLPFAAQLGLADYSDNALYVDTQNLFAGHVPYNVGGYSKGASHNLLGANLMTSTGSCGSLPSPLTASSWPSSLDPWWNNWKDQLFYALSYPFQPVYNHYQSCPNYYNCVSVSYTGYAALVFLSGPRLSALSPPQTRVNKSDITQYLEGNNSSHFPSTAGSGTGTYTAGAPSPTFNDVLCYISANNISVNCP